MKDQYTLRYYGKEADEGRMGYYDAASVILDFGDFIGIVSRADFGKECKLKTSVSTPKGGSVSFEFLLVSGSVLTALTSPMLPNDLWNLMRDAVEAWKFLRGKPQKEIVHAGGKMQMTNVNGDVNTFNQNTNIVINDPRAGEAVERIFNKPLNEADGRIDITSKQIPKEKIEVGTEDSGYFVDLSQRKIQTDQVFQITLTIVSPLFYHGNKWKFNDGESTFQATIEDEGFLRRVDNRESFVKGDLLKVKYHFLQEIANGRLKTTRTIKKVINHIRPPVNNDLFRE